MATSLRARVQSAASHDGTTLVLPALAPSPMHVTGVAARTSSPAVHQGRRMVMQELHQAKRAAQRMERENEALLERNRKLSASLTAVNEQVAALASDASPCPSARSTGAASFSHLAF